jgi:hypothetical protein
LDACCQEKEKGNENWKRQRMPSDPGGPSTPVPRDDLTNGAGEGSERGVLRQAQAQAHSVRRRAWGSSGLVQGKCNAWLCEWCVVSGVAWDGSWLVYMWTWLEEKEEASNPNQLKKVERTSSQGHESDALCLDLSVDNSVYLFLARN